MAPKGLVFMMVYVREYLDSEKERLIFDLDFAYYLTKNCPATKRKGPMAAGAFVFYLVEEGSTAPMA